MDSDWHTLGYMAATGSKGDKETAIRASEARREAQSLRDERDNAQEFKIRSIESQLKILKSGSKQPDSEISHPAKQRDELASNAESESGEDFRSSVLKSAKMRNRLAIANHFKQEDEFKESLSLSQKKKFDAEVKKVYENFLADSGVDRELFGSKGCVQACFQREETSEVRKTSSFRKSIGR